MVPNSIATCPTVPVCLLISDIMLANALDERSFCVLFQNLIHLDQCVEGEVIPVNLMFEPVGQSRLPQCIQPSFGGLDNRDAVRITRFSAVRLLNLRFLSKIINVAVMRPTVDL